MLKKVTSVLFLLYLSSFASVVSGSYYVTLKDNMLNPGNGKLIQTMFIVNDGKEIKAIELTAKRRSLSASGEEINTDTDDLLLIPSQLILPPGAERAVSIRWAGTKLVPREMAFRVIIEELPVGENQKSQSHMIRTKVKFIKSIYIAPKVVRESIRVMRAVRKIGPDGKSRLELKLLNNGTVHTIFHNLVLEYNAEGDKIANIKINASEIEPFKQSINILTGKYLEGWIPWPDEIDEATARFNMIAYNMIEEETEQEKKKKRSETEQGKKKKISN